MPIYHANYKAKFQRVSQDGFIVTFGAADDTHADAIAAVLDGATTAKRVSLTKRISVHNLSSIHPVGTRVTATAIVADINESIWKFRARNRKTDVEDDAITALLTGAAYGDPAHTYALAALSAPPTLPNTGLAVAVVRNVTEVIKR